MAISGISGDNTFFDSAFSSNSTGGTSLTSSLGDLSMIKNGTYKKALKAYYNKTEQTEEEKEADKKEKINLVNAKNTAESLNKAAESLRGLEYTKDNLDKIKSAVKEFVDSYNKAIDSGSEVDNKKVLRNTLWMTESTKVNAGLLSDAGISIGENNKLSLDETKFESADMSVLKTLFSGRGSYIDQVSQKTSAISNAAVDKVADGKSASAYTSSGSDFTQLSTGTLFDSTK